MDALKLNMRAKDQLHHYMTDLMSTYTKFPKSADWEGRPKLLHWCVLYTTRSKWLRLIFKSRLITLNQMRASEEITEAQSRDVSIMIRPSMEHILTRPLTVSALPRSGVSLSRVL